MLDDRLADHARHRACHAANPRYGVFGDRWAPLALRLAEAVGARTALDYGCGKGLLKPALPGLDVREYDPGIPGKDHVPEPADIVVCADVLPFVGEDRIDAVLDDIRRCAVKGALIVVPQHPRHKTHRDSIVIPIDKPVAWWRRQLHARWPAMRFEWKPVLRGTGRLFGTWP